MGPYVSYIISTSSLFTINFIHISCVSTRPQKPRAKHFHPFPPSIKRPFPESVVQPSSDSRKASPHGEITGESGPGEPKNQLKIAKRVGCVCTTSLKGSQLPLPKREHNGWKLKVIDFKHYICFSCLGVGRQNNHSLPNREVVSQVAACGTKERLMVIQTSSHWRLRTLGNRAQLRQNRFTVDGSEIRLNTSWGW